MLINLAKIKSRVRELGRLRYIDTRPLGPIEVRQTMAGTEEKTNRFTLNEGERWGELDSIYEMRFQATIPDEWKGQIVALHLDLSIPGESWAINTVEGLLFANGKELHAVDRYHREIFLPPELVEQKNIPFTALVWSGIKEPFHTTAKMELRWLDEGTEQLYSRMNLVLDALTALPEQSTNRLPLLAALDAACLALDFRQPRSPAFYASCAKAGHILQEHLQQIENETSSPWQPRVMATGHAHIDVAWLWQLRHTRLKAANTFSTALYHMDRYPNFVFTQSQPQLYEFVKEDRPEVYERIQQKVQAGQWEPEGAMWVEADTNITGGESLVRQFLFGQRFFQQEFGRKSRVLWLPDVFGYSAALPQLIKGAGADYFITTKISWNDTNRLPVDTFWWQGLDGSKVLAHFITAQNEESDRYFTYNAELRPGTLLRAWKSYQQKDLNRELLVAYGWGDGGGGPTREMVEALDQLFRPIHPDLPTVRPGGIGDFMENLDRRVSGNPDLPRWVGELYLEYHRGTYTSQAKVKKGNRFSERDLHNAEWLSSLSNLLCKQPYPQEELNNAWKIVLTNQFHDILPGSSIGPVYVDAAERYTRVEQVTSQVIEAAQESLTENIQAPADSLVVFNSLGWERTELVEMERGLAEKSGLPVQVLPDGQALVEVPQIPALGYRVYPPQRNQSSGGTGLAVNQNSLENRFYRVELNEQGQITRLLDKQAFGGAGREVLEPGARANVLQLFEDKPNNFDAWDIDAFYEQKSWEINGLVRAEVLEEGPLRAGLLLEWLYEGRTRIIQKLYLYANSRRIDFVTEVDWQERQTLLKVAFPVDVHNARATAEIQWGNLERSTHRNTSWDLARFETSAHKWFDLSEGDYGVAILNDCKYGYDIHNSTMRLTLLKGAIDPDPKADLGQHSFTYSLLPHSGNWFEGGVHLAAYELNFPLLAVKKKGNQPGTMPLSFSLLQADPSNVIVETVKKAEDSEALVVRLYECANRRGPFRMRLPFSAATIQETNLLEEPLQELEVSGDGRTFSGFIQPYEIKTFLITPRT